MARLTGPDEAVRLVYLTSGSKKGTAAAQGMSAVIYADSSLTSLADIRSTTGDAIPDSAVIIDAYSKIPLFQYPDGVDTVWTSINGGPAVPLYARTDDRLDALAAGLAALQPGGSGEAATAVDLDALDVAVVHKNGAETIAGVKTFSSEPVFPAPKAAASRLITAGAGLTGGGDLSADRTLAVAYGTTAGTAAQGNDSRLADARVPTARAIRLAVLGDSTARGTYSGDSQPGIDGAALLGAGNSWLTWAAVLSGGKVMRTKNAGVIGNTIAQMDARVVADICTAAEKPTACAVVSGYNDAVANVTLAAYATSVKSIVAKLRAYGIVPILCTPLPTSNNAAVGGVLVQYALFIRRYAAQQNLPLLDLQAWATDPVTGGLSAPIAAGGDGVHPGIAGQKLLGQKVADYLTPLVPGATVPLVQSPLDTTNLVPNGLFTGTPTSGRAPSVFVTGSLPAGATASVVTDPAVPGFMQRVTHAATATVAILTQRIPIAGKWAVGDLIAYSGVFTVTGGLHAEVWVESNASPYTYTKPITVDGDVTRGVFYAEAAVPPGSASYIDLQIKSGPGSGTVDYGQLTAYNLTALGIV